MFFIVPDTDDGLPFVDDEGEESVLDTEELSDDDPLAGGAPGGGASDDKVELDLEDAPFLEDDEEEEEEEEAPVAEELAPAPSLDEPKKAGESRLKALLANKKVVYGGGALLLLLIIGIVLFFVFGSTTTQEGAEPPPEKEEPAQPEPQPQQIMEPDEPEPAEFIVTWDTFWVEHEDKDGNIRFLICKFSAPTDQEKLAWEMRSKKITLRDAVFYYLRNKDLTFLSDKKNVDALKADLLKVINTQLSNGQLETLLVEEYLVK